MNGRGSRLWRGRGMSLQTSVERKGQIKKLMMKIKGLRNDDNEIREKGKGESGGVEVSCVDEVVVDDEDGGSKVELDGIVELVGVDAVDLHYIKVAAGREAVKDLIEEFRGGKTEI
ncbi:hypothetical protein HN51_007234 [Arachis hypogaea]